MTPPLTLSVIVVSFNMARELPRTVRTLSPAMQRGLCADQYEIIVVDNGSAVPPTEEEVRSWSGNAHLLTMGPGAPISPVLAINRAIEMSRGRLVGVFIDGARMASPGLLASAVNAAKLHQRPVIGTPAFHLGPEVQMQSVLAGYNQTVEDQLLETVDWEEDPYRLFEISVLAGSSSGGWFVMPAETNALFLSRDYWLGGGGYDPAFCCAGGGLANHDVWARACADQAAQIIMLFGEATFHQFHGGVATNTAQSPWQAFHAEYIRLRGHAYEKPNLEPILIGRLHKSVLPSLERSVEALGARYGLH